MKSAFQVFPHGAISITFASDSETGVKSITISDNGIGLTTRHLESFNICDTMEKANIGGRGVGRLVWLKAFGKVMVRSAFAAGKGTFEAVDFEFRPDLEDSRAGLCRTVAKESDIGMSISLTEVKETGSKLSMALLARSLCHHFFPFFIAGSMPATTVRIGSRAVDVGQYLSTRMSVESSDEIDVSDVGKIKIIHVYVDPKIARQLSAQFFLPLKAV